MQLSAQVVFAFVQAGLGGGVDGEADCPSVAHLHSICDCFCEIHGAAGKLKTIAHIGMFDSSEP